MIGAVLDGLKAGEDKARTAAEKVKAERYCALQSLSDLSTQ